MLMTSSIKSLSVKLISPSKAIDEEADEESQMKINTNGSLREAHTPVKAGQVETIITFVIIIITFVIIIITFVIIIIAIIEQVRTQFHICHHHHHF